MANVMKQLKAHPRVDIVDDERDFGNGVIVTLKAGFTFDQLCDNRVAGEDTASAMLATVRRSHVYTGQLEP